MTVGYYSPLPPAPTGVADYAAGLLAQLRRLGEVRVAPRRCDVALYHLGNNSLHADIYKRALEQPGVVVLHDAVLHHFFLGQLDRDEYIEEFVYNYGGWHRELAADLWRSRATSGSDPRYFEFPMLKRIAERSRAIVVHNPAARRMVQRHCPGSPVFEIPHFYQPPEAISEAELFRYRQQLGFETATTVFGTFGFLRETKRLLNVLEVFGALRRELPNIGLLVAGAFVSGDLERAAKPLLAIPGVVCRPFLSARDLSIACASVDAGINLRYPPAGETSGMVIRLMGLGKPVLLTDSEECSRFPEDGCLRVPAGLEERDSLWSHMVLLTSLPEVARAVGQRAAEHIRAHHGLDQIAQRYWDTLCGFCC
ncbi:MAG: glycosyltransferase [Acidobacteriia bacterium]|nr:glycosyltransferase [Terriglobia bacterium]